MPPSAKAPPTMAAAPGKATAAPSPVRARIRRLPGNQALLRLQRNTAAIQPKVAAAPADDPFEREADTVAHQVMQSAEGTDAPVVQRSEPAATPQVRRYNSPVEEDDDSFELRRKAFAARPSSTELTPRRLTAGGRPLSDAVRRYFESRFGRDFSNVRVHTGIEAEIANRDLDSLAFTYGAHIWLGRGQQVQATELLAHELTHVVQQTDPPAAARAGETPPGSEAAPHAKDATIDPAEREQARASVDAMGRSRGEPLPIPEAQRFGAALDAPVTGVRIHLDAAANEAAANAGARAVSFGRDIYFASGQYAPGTAEGDRLLAHELWHALHDGRGDASVDLRLSHAADAAERGAEAAESAAVPPAGARPAADADAPVPGADLPVPSPVRSSGVLHRDPADVARWEEAAADENASVDARSEAIARLVRDRSRPALEALWRLATRRDDSIAFETTRVIAQNAGNDAALWDIVLASASVSTWTAGTAFSLWMTRAGGQPAIRYFDRALASSDPVVQRNAARTVVLVLSFEEMPENRRFRDAYQALREMARRRGFGTAGVLGVESLLTRVGTLLDALAAIAGEMLPMVAATPQADDPRQADDLAALDALRRHFVAGRQELDALGDVPASQLPILDQRTAQLTELLEAFTVTATRTRTLHDNAAMLRRFLGPDVQSDEVTALYQVRSYYVGALAVHNQAPPRPTPIRRTGEPEENFTTLWLEAQRHFDQYDEVVAAVKWRRVRPRIADANNLFNQGFAVRPGGGRTPDLFYQQMRSDFERRRDDFAQRFARSIAGTVGGTYVVVRGYAPAPVSLREAIQVELAVALHGFDAALFTLYAMALRLTDELLTHDIGDEDFRAGLITELDGIRARLSGFWRREAFREFSDAAGGIQQQLRSITERIEHQIHIDILVNLLITLVAALISAGVGAVARIAMMGEVIAGVRTAQSAATIVFLVEAGAFTATQLSGEWLAHGTAPTLGRVATAAVENLAFFGAFRAVGRLTAGFSQSTRIAAFVGIHAANLATMTAVSALLTRIETGAWPGNIGLFLLNTAASYVIVAAVHGAVRSQLTNPRLTAQMRTALETMDARNTALLDELRASTAAGTLNEEGFNRIRDAKVDLYSRLLEMVRFGRSEALINADDATALEQFFTDQMARDSSVSYATYMNLAAITGRLPTARALPSPQDVTGLVRVGETNVFRYDAAASSQGIPRLLAAYDEAGYGVSGTTGDAIRVTAPNGGTAMVLLPASSGAPLPMLPASTAGQERGFVARATGVPQSDVARVEGSLARLNRQTLATLQGEFPEPTAMAAVSLLAQQSGALTTPWRLDAVRGLATMLEVERGIVISNVRRLFLAFDSAELNDLFSAYWRITRAAGTTPGANLLVATDWTPQRSQRLIRAYDALRLAQRDLPPGMDELALIGLLRMMDDHPSTWIAELGRITPVARRLEALQRLATGSTTTPTAAAALEDVVRRLSADIAPGLNPLHGTPDVVAQAIEQVGQASNGGLHDAGVRSRLIDVIRRFQDDMRRLQNGMAGFQENAMGGRQELIAVIDALRTGGEIVQFGPVSSELRVTVSPGLFDLGRGIRVVNAPSEVDLQIDVVIRRVTGQGDLLSAIEVTDADLTLPAAWQVLDPDSQIAPTNISWTDLSPSSSTSHRKWHQIIKLYAAVAFASELGRHWGSGPVQVPRKVVRARSFSANAQRALRALGFEVEVIP